MMDKANFQNYLAIEAAGGATWHFEKEKIAFVHNAPGTYQIFTTQIVEGRKIWPDRLTFEEDRCTAPFYLSDGSMVFHTDEGGNENYQLYLITPENHQVRITDDDKAKHVITFKTETHVYYMANISNKSIFGIYRRKIPLDEHDAELLFQPQDGYFIPMDTNEEEKILLLTKYYSNNHSEVYTFNITTQTLNNLTSPFIDQKTNRWLAPKFTGDNSVIVLSDFESEYLRPILINNGETGGNTMFDDFSVNFENIIYSEILKKYFVTTNEDGYSKLYQFQLDGSKFVNFDQIELPVEGVIVSADARSFTNGLDIAPRGKYLAVTISSSTSPLNIWIINLESGFKWKATHTSTPGLDPRNFMGETLHKFASFDGLKVPYYKYLPDDKSPAQGWPTIFVIHGGPESQYRPSFNALAQYFTSSNKAIIAPNIRGSTGYERSYMDLDNKEKRLDSIMDIKHLALHLSNNDPDIDGNNLIIYGGSYGGFAVLSSLVEHPEIWKAGVDIVGISNFVTFLENTAPWRRKLREEEYGSLEQDRDMLERISPINKIDEIKAPLFIIQGDNDERVPLSESIQIHQKLKETGLNTKLLRFADEGHGLSKRKNQLVAYPEMVKWLNTIIESS